MSSSPASVFSSPSAYGRPSVIDEAIKQTPRGRASPFSTKYYTPSPLERNNNNLIKSLSSALSSTPRSLKKPFVLHTPQSVSSQLAWHPHSTPQSQIKNPFEIALVNQLQNSLVSPGIFTISTPNSDEKKFHWTIDQLAVLHPVEIEDKPSQYASVISPSLEEKAQKDIDKYFSTHIIVPSPVEDSVKVEKNENPLESAEYKKFVDVGCQTTLNLPENVNLYDILGEYMTYKDTDKKQDNDYGAMDSFSTSSLRRKLFCQGNQEDSFASNKGSTKSDDEASCEDELPAPIPSTPDWDRRLSMDLLSSSPVNRRSRRYMSNLSRDSFGCTHSSPNFSPIGPPSSPLSSRSQRQERKGSHIYLEDSRKQLFSSPCSSPVHVADDSLERNLIDEGKMDISIISLKTPTSSPNQKMSDSTGLILNTSFFKMSPLFSSVKKELKLIDPNTNWNLDSENEVSLISSEENPQRLSTEANTHSLCEKIETSLSAGDAEGEWLCSIDQTRDNTTKNNNNNTQNKNNAMQDLQNITSSMSANFSIIPSKLEVTNVDNSRYTSTLQHDTGYMSYNTTGSMPSRSEISQCSKLAFSIYNTSSQDIPESVMDTAKLLSEKGLMGIPQSKAVGLKTSNTISYADSLLDYEEVVDRAQQVLTLTSKFCNGQSEKHQAATEINNDKSSDQTDLLQWQPIGASTPTHKGHHKSASETAAEILQKAQEDLKQLSRDKVILT